MKRITKEDYDKLQDCEVLVNGGDWKPAKFVKNHGNLLEIARMFGDEEYYVVLRFPGSVRMNEKMLHQ